MGKKESSNSNLASNPNIFKNANNTIDGLRRLIWIPVGYNSCMLMDTFDK